MASMQLIQRMSANTRYFTDKSNRPVLSVAAGNCAAGMCLDFAALSQLDNLETRHEAPLHLGLLLPTFNRACRFHRSFKGAPNSEVAELFIRVYLVT